MGIAVHEQDGLPEGESEVAQGVAELREPVALVPDFSLEIRIRLREDHHAGEVARTREPQAVLQPGDYRVHARAMLGVAQRAGSGV